MRLRIFKLFLIGLVMAGIICIPAFAINFESGFDTGKLSASSTTVDCTNWSNHLSCAQRNQQQVDDVLDQLSFQTPLVFANSLQNVLGTVNLVGDSTSPGNNYYYGTNGSGVKGFYAITPGGVTSVTASLPLTSSGGTAPNIALNYNSSLQLSGSNLGVNWTALPLITVTHTNDVTGSGSGTTGISVADTINWNAVDLIKAVQSGNVNWQSISSYATGSILTATTAGGVNWNTSGTTTHTEDHWEFSNDQTTYTP